MRIALVTGMLLLLCACESVRTVYDEFGNEVKESKTGGGEKDLTAHMEEKWNNSFSEKKNDQGIPQAVSNRVSSFQKDLDDASGTGKQFFTKSYGGVSTNEAYAVSYAGAGKKFGVKEAYTGGDRGRIDKDLHPAFATAGKGVYSTADSYARAGSRYAQEGAGNVAADRSFPTNESFYNGQAESGYFESRRESMPAPRVMSRGEYYQKSVEETRMMLGRDD